MKAILTKAHGAHRIQATDNDGNTVRIDKAGELQHEEQHDAAARALCEKMHWHGTLSKGYMLRAGVTVGRVYVWAGKESDESIVV
jgi:hypothetical protein